MNEVFNVEYKGEEAHYDDDDQYMEVNRQGKNVGRPSGNGKQLGSRITAHSFRGNGFVTLRNQGEQIQGTQSFQNFITRNNKWCEKK